MSSSKALNLARPRVALIGAGRWGRNHLRVLRALHRAGRVDFAGVVARNARRARAISAEHGVRAYARLEDALADRIDIVDIAAASSAHGSLVRRSIPHAHVFVEKPLALTVAECASLYRLARRHSRLLGVGHIFRFNHAVTQVKRILARRTRPHAIRIEMTGSSRPPDDTGAVLTFLHAFDLLDELVGPPRMTIPIVRVRSGARLESYAVVALAYPPALAAIVEVGWIGGPRRRVLEVSFEKVQVRSDLVRQTVELAGPTRRSERRYYRAEPLRLELEHFMGAVRGRHAVRPSPADVLRVMQMAQDARTALGRGRAVRWRH